MTFTLISNSLYEITYVDSTTLIVRFIDTDQYHMNFLTEHGDRITDPLSKPFYSITYLNR